jgi:hypothetical protein
MAGVLIFKGLAKAKSIALALINASSLHFISTKGIKNKTRQAARREDFMGSILL